MNPNTLSITFYRFQLVGLLGVMLIMVTLMQWQPQWDFALSQWFFDNARQQFVYDDHWLWRGWLHDGARDVLKPMQFTLLTVLLAAVVWPRYRRYRSGFLYVLLTVLTTGAILTYLKKISDRACPINLTMFGGKYEWQALFSTLIEQHDGRCWPGGHALHAFGLLPLYFLLHYWQYQRAARGLLIAIVIAGTVFSLTQIIRGQHFLSHQLATLLVAWTIAVVGLYGLQRYDKKRMVNG